MTEIPTYLIPIILLCALLASIGIWAPRKLGLKFIAVTATITMMPLGYAAMAALLSRPKPVELEWWLNGANEATVLGSTMREGQGIYIYLQLEDSVEPRSYVLPWDRQLAEELQQALQEAEDNQSAVQMRLPFEPSYDDREPKFYALPQPAHPPKNGMPPPEIYQHPEQAA
ncbi:MAG: hypothetical protein AAFY56_21090 [Pseudomonadota bacterium]